MNNVIKAILNRSTLRQYSDKMISDNDLDMIIKSAMRAPTAGNQMLYSMIIIKNKETKEKLSKSCDNQGFIAQAPIVITFVADQQKWFDYYKFNDVKSFAEKENLKFQAPQESDLFLAIEDTMIAAQTAVIAAESLGVGSCYIGDILENYEYHQELLNLPEWTLPVSLICFGYPKEGIELKRRDRFAKEFVVFEEEYKHLNKNQLNKMFENRSKKYNSKNAYNASNYAQMFYARKTGANFSKEMARSVKVALKKWAGEIL